MTVEGSSKAESTQRRGSRHCHHQQQQPGQPEGISSLPLERQASVLKPRGVLARWQQVLQRAQRLRHQAVQVALSRHQHLHGSQAGSTQEGQGCSRQIRSRSSSRDCVSLVACLHRAWEPAQEKTLRCLPASTAPGSAEETEAAIREAGSAAAGGSGGRRPSGAARVSAGLLALAGYAIKLPRRLQAAHSTWSLTAAAQHSAATAWAPPAIADVLADTATACQMRKRCVQELPLPAQRRRDGCGPNPRRLQLPSTAGIEGTILRHPALPASVLQFARPCARRVLRLGAGFAQSNIISAYSQGRTPDGGRSRAAGSRLARAAKQEARPACQGACNGMPNPSTR